jgi:hypothetical protein
MLRTNIFLLSILAMLVTFAGQTSAWDGQRKGFVLGFGVGGSQVNYDMIMTEEGWYWGYDEVEESVKKTTVFTDFTIGYAPSNQVMFFYSNRVSWIGSQEFDLEFIRGEDSITSGISSLGARYYLSPNAPAFFFSGGLGPSVWNWMVERKTGTGVYFDVGAELSPHVDLKLSVVLGGLNGNGDDPYQLTSDVTTYAATFNLLGY